MERERDWGGRSWCGSVGGWSECRGWYGGGRGMNGVGLLEIVEIIIDVILEIGFVGNLFMDGKNSFEFIHFI